MDQPDELREGGVMEHDFFHVWGTIHECRICSLKTDNPSRTVAACLTKPATTEPPEWKIAPVPQALLDLAEMGRKARQEVCGITDLMRGVSSAKPPEWLCSRRGESAVLWHWWIDRGHKGGPACETCGTTIQAFRDEDRLCATPFDRALSDFTARRKAKREAAEINQASIERHGRKRGNFTFRDQRAEPLSRAMSTPLPHDPDIHTRLMPWRGRE